MNGDGPRGKHQAPDCTEVAVQPDCIEFSSAGCRVVATKIHPYRSTNMLLDDKDRDLGPELSRGQHVPPHAQLRELAPIGEAARERRRPFQVIALTDAVPSASSTVFSM
jgi:hypothetical protein